MKKRSVKEGRCVGSGRSVGRRKASGTSAREKRPERRQGESRRSVGRRKAGETLPKRKRKTKEKRAVRQPEKSGRTVSGEKRTDRRQGKAGKQSAEKSRRSVGRRKADKPSARKQAAKAKKAAGKILRLFCISGQRAERPAISRSARYSRRRPASPAVWWRRPFHGRPPSAARPFRRRRSP